MADTEVIPDDDGLDRAVRQVISTDMPLGTGLRIYAEEYPPSSRGQLLALAEAVEAGMPLDAAIRSSTIRLSPYLAELIEGGLRSQRISPMLDEYLSQRRIQKRLGQRNTLNLIYPFLVMYAAAAICLAILTWLVPTFEEIFRDFGVELPMLTLLLITISHWAQFMIIPLISVFVIVGALVLMLVVSGKWSRILVDELPLLGDASRYASMAEFCSLLAPLVETSVPLPEAIRAVGKAMWPSKLRRKVRALAETIDGSFDLADLASARRMPSEIVHVLRWEHRGQAFGEILRSWSNLFSQFSEGRSAVFTTLITPLLVLGVAGAIGLVVVALFLPLMKLLNELS